MANFKIGERQTFEFVDSASGETEEILDYIYVPVNSIKEIFNKREVTSRDLLLVLLADNSVVMVSLETGKHLLWFDLDLSALDVDDEIVDLVPTQMTNEPYFMILTKKGKLLFYHFVVIDNSTSLKKYLRHLKRYDRPVE